MTREQFNACPQEQQAAFVELQSRAGIPFDRLLAEAISPTTLSPYIGVPNFHGMFVGIEEDGYIHS